jgi:hypothetical protein
MVSKEKVRQLLTCDKIQAFWCQLTEDTTILISQEKSSLRLHVYCSGNSKASAVKYLAIVKEIGFQASEIIAIAEVEANERHYFQGVLSCRLISRINTLHSFLLKAGAKTGMKFARVRVRA